MSVAAQMGLFVMGEMAGVKGMARNRDQRRVGQLVGRAISCAVSRSVQRTEVGRATGGGTSPRAALSGARRAATPKPRHSTAL